MRSHIIVLSVLAIALAGAPYCFAQTPAQKLLPDRFGSWTATNSVAKRPAQWPVDVTEEEVAFLKEAGIEEWVARSYSSGSQTLHVNLERFHDPSGAYEAYTALLDTDLQPSTVGQMTAIGHGRLIMLIGNFLVTVEQPQLASTADLTELASFVRKSADTTPLPPIRSFLPQGFVDGTQRYALGPAAFQAALNKLGESEFAPLTHEAGFDFGAEAIFADYHKGQESGVLLLIDYPTPQLAEQHLRHLDAALPPAQKQAGTTVERKGSLLSLVLKPPSSAFAAELRSGVHYQTEVTWNEPTHKLTDPSWAVILARIFIVTLLFMGLAIALGIAYGIVRVLLKNLFPGKILDRPGQMEVLQLGLSSKRIDPRDFY